VLRRRGLIKHHHTSHITHRASRITHHPHDAPLLAILLAAAIPAQSDHCTDWHLCTCALLYWVGKKTRSLYCVKWANKVAASAGSHDIHSVDYTVGERVPPGPGTGSQEPNICGIAPHTVLGTVRELAEHSVKGLPKCLIIIHRPRQWQWARDASAVDTCSVVEPLKLCGPGTRNGLHCMFGSLPPG
jgi:hypothetical protein